MKHIYSKMFDSNCIGWEEDRKFNLVFLKAKQNYYNDLLRARGYVFLRDIYEELGFPITRKTLFAGWVFDLENLAGDHYIDFGIATKDGESTIRLDFNADENITDWFKKES